MSKNSSYMEASDIITYIGVPLAVLGVTPILYNTITTLATLSKVRRLLRKSRLAGITRGDVINHVIECELARFSIAPLDRDDNAEEYWNIYEHPSLVPGGSWTILNWKMHAIGMKTQRIEYTDQLRQPQAEIGFEELIGYLLDLGAVPSASGFRMLRTSGLWIPVGTPLLLSPDGHEAVLTIAPLDDSDGMLSLAIRWGRHWKVRDKDALPPYWIRIALLTPQYNYDVSETEQIAKATKEGEIIVASDETEERKNLDASSYHGHEQEGFEATFEETSLASSKSMSTMKDLKKATIRCHITANGIVSALKETSSGLQALSITHLLQQSSGCSEGDYFSSVCTAVSSINHTVLWSYHIPSAIIAFSKGPLIPCGVLVLLDIVPISETPEWYTTYNDAPAESDRQFKRMRETMAATQQEAAMTPAQRAVASRERFSRQHQNFVDDMKEKQRREAQRRETRVVEALQSPHWKAKLVGDHALTWLKANNIVDKEDDITHAVEIVLSRFLTDAAYARGVADILDAWKGWVEGGGICRSDYMMLQEKKEAFAWAALVVAAICESAEIVHGSLAMDLQESIAVWKKVRLG